MTSVKILVLEKQNEETKNRESQTRQANKVCTLTRHVRSIANTGLILSLFVL
jgi:hypothetical protein